MKFLGILVAALPLTAALIATSAEASVRKCAPQTGSPQGVLIVDEALAGTFEFEKVELDMGTRFNVPVSAMAGISAEDILQMSLGCYRSIDPDTKAWVEQVALVIYTREGASRLVASLDETLGELVQRQEEYLMANGRYAGALESLAGQSGADGTERTHPLFVGSDGLERDHRLSLRQPHLLRHRGMATSRAGGAARGDRLHRWVRSGRVPNSARAALITGPRIRTNRMNRLFIALLIRCWSVGSPRPLPSRRRSGSAGVSRAKTLSATFRSTSSTGYRLEGRCPGTSAGTSMRSQVRWARLGGSRRTSGTSLSSAPSSPPKDQPSRLARLDLNEGHAERLARSALEDLVTFQTYHRHNRGRYALKVTDLELYRRRWPLMIEIEPKEGGWSASTSIPGGECRIAFAPAEVAALPGGSGVAPAIPRPAPRPECGPTSDIAGP